MNKQSKNAEASVSLKILTLVKANVMAYVVTAIFVLFSSVILTYTNATPKFENLITLIGIGASAFLVGYDTAKIEGRNGYKWGIIGGALYFMIFLILGTALGQTNHLEISTLLKIACIVLITSCVAGMISVNASNDYRTFRRSDYK